MNAPRPIPPLMRIPPPLLFMGFFVVGVGLQHLARLTVPDVHLLHLAGLALLACAASLALCCVGLFAVARTTIVPFSAASKLVTSGPYRFTRNPMYVSLALAYLGIAVILSQGWALILLPIPLIIVHTVVIPFEEGRMREVFGESYDEYRTRVRRWL